MVDVSVHCAWHQGRVRWRMAVLTVSDSGGLGGGC